MKKMFPGFYRPTENEFKELWKECTFVIDANVLLNLYRYPTEARDDLLQVFTSLEKRLWVPFQAALEYQRNRIGVIAEQKKRFQEVDKVVSGIIQTLESDFNRLQLKDKHAVIDPSQFIEKMNPIIAEFKNELSELEKGQNNIHDDDLLRERIDTLFEGKVGPSPDSEFIAEVMKEGKTRYEMSIPPGYMDEKKGNSIEGSYSYGGISYEAKYGDLIFWKQTINFAKVKKLSSLVIITDDEKEDWWWKYDSQGQKTLGPRPELVEEIKRVSGLKGFYMYNTEGFLKFSQNYLSSKINKDSISQVEEVKRSFHINYEDFLQRHREAETAVGEWLREQLPSAQVKYSRGWPSFTIIDSEKNSLFGVEVFVNVRSARLIQEKVYRAYHDVNEGKFTRIEFIIVMLEEEAMEVSNPILRIKVPNGVKISYGRITGDGSNTGEKKFVKLGEISPQSTNSGATIAQ